LEDLRRANEFGAVAARGAGCADRPLGCRPRLRALHDRGARDRAARLARRSFGGLVRPAVDDRVGPRGPARAGPHRGDACDGVGTQPVLSLERLTVDSTPIAPGCVQLTVGSYAS